MRGVLFVTLRLTSAAVNQEVGQQGESIDRVEANTTNANANVEGGTRELGTVSHVVVCIHTHTLQAAKLANAIRKKKLIIILLCICICIVRLLPSSFLH